MNLTFRFPSFSARILFPEGVTGYDEEWVGRKLVDQCQEWRQQAECLKICLTQRGHLCVFHLKEEDRLLTIRLVDLVDLSDLNLAMDPRSCPARVNGWDFEAKPVPTWETAILLCAFDSVLRSRKFRTGLYPVWPGVEARVKVDKRKKALLMESLEGLPLSVERGIVL